MTTEVPASGIVTLLTDFGLSDPFVGVMKGVLIGTYPGIELIDLTHGIRPGSIAEGAFWLALSHRYFPLGTVHLAVVDPGVGSSRAVIAVRASGHYFVGPDNGLLAEAAARSADAVVREVHLARLSLGVTSHTFHGRDVFSHVAGRLAAGVDSFERLGPIASLVAPSPIPAVHRVGGDYAGVVVTVDHFGNLLTNLRASEVLPHPDAPFWLNVRGLSLRRVRTYAEADPGELCALVGSFDVIEIARRDGSAAESLALGPGSKVRLGWQPLG